MMRTHSWIATRSQTLDELIAWSPWSGEETEESIEQGIFALRVGAWAILAAHGRTYAAMLTAEQAQELGRREALFFANDEKAKTAEAVNYKRNEMDWRVLSERPGRKRTASVEGRLPSPLQRAFNEEEDAFARAEAVAERHIEFTFEDAQPVQLLHR